MTLLATNFGFLSFHQLDPQGNFREALRSWRDLKYKGEKIDSGATIYQTPRFGDWKSKSSLRLHIRISYKTRSNLFLRVPSDAPLDPLGGVDCIQVPRSIWLGLLSRPPRIWNLNDRAEMKSISSNVNFPLISIEFRVSLSLSLTLSGLLAEWLASWFVYQKPKSIEKRSANEIFRDFRASRSSRNTKHVVSKCIHTQQIRSAIAIFCSPSKAPSDFLLILWPKWRVYHSLWNLVWSQHCFGRAWAWKSHPTSQVNSAYKFIPFHLFQIETTVRIQTTQ